MHRAPAGTGVARYEGYGRLLEAEHWGRYIAIGVKGETIGDDGDVAVAQDGVRRFGAGSFACRRLGRPFLTRWHGPRSAESGLRRAIGR